MHIRISDPEALPELVDALSERAHFVVGAVARDRVAAGVLGSFADGGEDELRRFVQEWAKGRPGVDAEVVLDSESVSVLPFPLPENVRDAREEA